MVCLKLAERSMAGSSSLPANTALQSDSPYIELSLLRGPLQSERSDWFAVAVSSHQECPYIECPDKVKLLYVSIYSQAAFWAASIDRRSPYDDLWVSLFSSFLVACTRLKYVQKTQHDTLLQHSSLAEGLGELP